VYGASGNKRPALGRSVYVKVVPQFVGGCCADELVCCKVLAPTTFK